MAKQFFRRIGHIIDGLDEEESDSIVQIKKVIAEKNLFTELTFIKANFSFMPTAITELEARGSPIAGVMKKMTQIRERLNAMKNKTFAEKWDKVTGKNPGFTRIENVSKMIEGENIKDNDREAIKSLYSPAEIAALKCAPLSSADVERVFSQFKNIFRDNRHNFTFENLRTHVLFRCNCNVSLEE